MVDDAEKGPDEWNGSDPGEEALPPDLKASAI